MKDWLGDIGHAERVARLWCETADWTAHVSETGRQTYLALSDQVFGLQARRRQVFDELVGHKKALIEAQAKLDDLLNPSSSTLIGVARQTSTLSQQIAIHEQDSRDRTEDIEVIDRKITDVHRQMAVAEKAIRQSIYAEIGRQAELHVQRSMEQWLDACPVSDLCLSMALNENHLVAPVARVLAKFIEASKVTP